MSAAERARAELLAYLCPRMPWSDGYYDDWTLAELIAEAVKHAAEIEELQERELASLYEEKRAARAAA